MFFVRTISYFRNNLSGMTNAAETSDMDSLYQLYTGIYGHAPSDASPLYGSGSNRRYVRLASSAGESCMGVTGTDVNENKAFLTLAGHFKSKGIPVPEIYAVSADGLSYLQEDLGDTLLYDMVDKARKEGSWDAVSELLCRTMALLPKIQFEGADGLDFSVCYPQPSFDRRMVLFDLNYFKYCFLKPSGLEFNEVRLQDDLEKLADDLLDEEHACDGAEGCPDPHKSGKPVPQTFLYRDFNARNVMVKDGQPYFIDFQGGRRGPIYYDVASFVWQARAKYPQELKNMMVESYVEALSEYTSVEPYVFNGRLRIFLLFRLLQVLGAYGFRGLIEHKAQFVTSIPPALASLSELLDEPFRGQDAAELEARYPYLVQTLRRLTALPRFAAGEEDGRLEVKVYSFSFKKGIPEDLSGNGGGYVFDCRSLHNPGRYEPYKKLTGRDEPVIRFLEDDGEVFGFMEHVYGVVDPHVETYAGRGFTHLSVSFGCTGGQHRSVYCAEHLAAHLTEKYPSIRVRLIHREHP